MPFWSSEAQARRIVRSVQAFAGFEVESIDLAAWRDRWLPGLQRDGILVGLNWTGERATGFDLEPTTALARLTAATCSASS